MLVGVVFFGDLPIATDWLDLLGGISASIAVTGATYIVDDVDG